MLQRAIVTAAVPVLDMARAREFYATKLGLLPTLDEGDILEFECGKGTWFFLFVSGGHSAGEFTQVAFEVDGLDAVVIS